MNDRTRGTTPSSVSREAARSTFPRKGGRKEVIVIGGANVDIKGRSSDRFIPGTSNPGQVNITPGGVGRNIAHNLALLGVAIALVSVTGSDANGVLLSEACSSVGIDTSMLITGAVPTGVYLAVVDEHGELVSAINDMRAIDALTPEHLSRNAERLAAASMLVADCNISTACLAWLMDFARQSGTRLLIEPVSVPKARKLLELNDRAAFLITPNAAQLRALSGTGDEIEGITRLHAMGFANVVLHRGPGGVIVSDGLTAPMTIPSVGEAMVQDVTGAGDAAVAGLVFGLVAGHPLHAAARLGQAAASLKLGSLQSVAAGMNRDNLLALAGMSQHGGGPA